MSVQQIKFIYNYVKILRYYSILCDFVVIQILKLHMVLS